MELVREKNALTIDYSLTLTLSEGIRESGIFTISEINFRFKRISIVFNTSFCR